MTKTLTRAEIYDAVWKKPMCDVAKDYAISPSTMSRVCKRNNIPAPGRGHWSRVDAGYVVDPPPLPRRPGKEQVKFNDHGRKSVTVKKMPRIAPPAARSQPPAPIRALPPNREDFEPKNCYVVALQARMKAQIIDGRSTVSTHGRSEFRVSILPRSAHRVVRILDTLCLLAEINQLGLRPSRHGLAFDASSYRVAVAVTEQISADPSPKSRLELRLDDRNYKDGIQRRFADHPSSGLEHMLSRCISSIQECVTAAEQRQQAHEHERGSVNLEAARKNISNHDIVATQLSGALIKLEEAARECREALNVVVSSSPNCFDNKHGGQKC